MAPGDTSLCEKCSADHEGAWQPLCLLCSITGFSPLNRCLMSLRGHGQASKNLNFLDENSFVYGCIFLGDKIPHASWTPRTTNVPQPPLQRALTFSNPVSQCTPPSVCWSHCGVLALSLKHSRLFCSHGSLCSRSCSCPDGQALLPACPADPWTLPCGPETCYLLSPTGLLWEVRAYPPGLSACPAVTHPLGDITLLARGCLGHWGGCG